MVGLVDTHCHLTEAPLADDLSGVLERASARGVTTTVAPAFDLASWAAVEALRRAEHAGLFVAFGLHPWVAAEPLSVAALERALDRPGVIAVGEIGLDTKIADCDLERQREVLALQLDLAVDRDLPVMLHCRGAFDELLKLLADRERRGRPVRGVVHAFSRSPELARRFLDLGLYLGFGGTITHPRARARQAAATVPRDRILVETDAPSIGLAGIPAAETEPQHVRDIAEALAELRGEPLDLIAGETTDNARRLFAIDTV